MLLIINLLIGVAIVLGCLFMVGITRGNRVSQKTWVILWSIISVGSALFLIASVIMQDESLLDYALGCSLGYVAAVSIHTIDHTLEGLRKGSH